MSAPRPVGSMRNPMQRARGFGSAKSGVRHWWVQRLTAAALIVLGLWFVYMVLSLLHADYATAREVIARPWNAVLMFAFVATALWHGQLGLQVVVEDYVHTRWLEFTLIGLFKLLAVLLSLACALAVLSLALGG